MSSQPVNEGSKLNLLKYVPGNYFYIIAYRTHLGYTFTIIIAVVLSLTIIITVGGCLGLPLALCLLKMHVRVLLSVSLKVYLVNYRRSWGFSWTPIGVDGRL